MNSQGRYLIELGERLKSPERPEAERVFESIRLERNRQDEKFGCQREQPYPVWNTILSEEVGEAAKEVLERDITKLRTELVQVAAVAVAWIEAIDAERGSFR